MKHAVHYSSETVEWPTPQWLFDALNEEFHFTLDPCATPENAKCERFFTEAMNGLHQDWSDEVVFMNPPYGPPLKLWIRKAYKESKRGATVVCLVPSRTDTGWWHQYAMKGEIRFMRGRVPFVRADGLRSRAPFPTAIVVFRPAGYKLRTYSQVTP